MVNGSYSKRRVMVAFLVCKEDHMAFLDGTARITVDRLTDQLPKMVQHAIPHAYQAVFSELESFTPSRNWKGLKIEQHDWPLRTVGIFCPGHLSGRQGRIWKAWLGRNGAC